MMTTNAFILVVLLSFLAIFTAAEDQGFGGSRYSLYGGSHNEKRDNCARTCLSDAGVPFLDSQVPDYQQLVSNYTFNLRISVEPVAIAQPKTQKQVSDAVVCGATAGVKVQARSGGHSYANFGLGGHNGSLVIDLVNFQDYSLSDNKVATIGAGTKLGDMAQKLYHDGRALPHGSCAGIGIGGHATHGGYGYASRSWGLTLDTIVALDVVLANGTFVQASATHHPDIFYALRGAADSFGIVIEFHFKTVSAPPTSVNFFWNFAGLNDSAEAATTALMNLQDFARSQDLIDSKLSFGIFFNNQAWSVRGVYLGTDDQFAPLRKKMLQGLPPLLNTSTSHSDSWLKSLIEFNDGVTFDPPKIENDTFFAKSVVVPESSPITPDAAKNYFTYAINKGPKSGAGFWFSIINLYGGYGSNIPLKLGGASAGDNDRDALWVFQHYASAKGQPGPFPQSALSFIAGLNDAIEKPMPNTKFGGYPNYVDPSLSADEAHKLYFGDEIYSKLVELKKELDPQNVFWNPQSVVT